MSEQDAGGSGRVWHDEMWRAFIGEEIEKDGIIAEVEAVIGNSDDPSDSDARYSLEVRVRSVDTSTGSGGDGR